MGSVGKTPPTLTAKVVDDQGDECPPGVRGELVFQNADGSCPTVDYYRNPEASQAKMRGGWFHTGDIAHRDEDGWLYFDYRVGDAIRHNGEFIDPGYVQKVISENPAVDGGCVSGIRAGAGVAGEREHGAGGIAGGRRGCAPDKRCSARETRAKNFTLCWVGGCARSPSMAGF